MIELKEVAKSFGSLQAVKNLNLTVKAGEIFGLVGPDGAGKTTIIRLLTGLLTANHGEMSILGAARPQKVKDQLGYVPQKFSLYGDLTVLENLQLLGSLYGSGQAEIEKKATEILSFTHLLPFANRLADHLSGGMKQKLALAAGLMHRPQLLFLDEPTTGVDPVSRREFWHMLYRLNKEGMTIFVSTPYMDEAELCSRLAFLHEGKIVAEGRPHELKQNYPYDILELKVQLRQVRSILANCNLVDVNAFGDQFHLVVQNGDRACQEISAALRLAGHQDFQLTPIEPSLEDLFVHLASEVV